MQRQIVLNWKSYLTIQQSIELADKIAKNFSDTDKFELTILPHVAAAQQVSRLCKQIGLQNIYPYEAGAYTGEVTLNIAREINARYCLVGHSERRVYFGETDSEVYVKAQFLLAHNITPIICIGENAQEHDTGKREEVLRRQMEICTDGLDMSKVLLAYEPVWAISGFTGSQVASIDDIVAAHTFIRTCKPGQELKILYGGSVKETIESDYLDSTEIQGFLVGSMGTQWDDLKNFLERL